MNEKFKIITSPHMGYCFGVKRAIKLLMEGVGEFGGDNIYTLGEIIHNPQAVQKIKNMGVKSAESLSDVSKGDTLVIRAHGVERDIFDAARRKRINLIDTTCPFVKRSQEYVQRLHSQGRSVIIIGHSDHPEVIGISGHAKNKPIVIKSVEEAESLSSLRKAGVITQTTFSREKSDLFIEVLKNHIPDLIVYDTICQATVRRQIATMSIASEVDIMLVVGGKKSSNTKRLHMMCLENGISSKHIEVAAEIDPGWFEGVDKIGLTTGTSTPDWVIEEVEKKLNELAASG
ncbi:MAG TPA: 4-hydroxy-3-methylbut-2-enyl diphosphate reductase [Candidatus Krumholzibacteriaceae bacterium]|nr:4-hydroxy-3-methylbut-2-enyl diphosphate reductase [Candidatus Krumholzibacteriaceae bacterium]